MPSFSYTYVLPVLAAVGLLCAGCIAPQPKDTMILAFDSARNVTALRSQPELIEQYPVWAGYDPELRLQAMYECPGSDTGCLPLALRLRFIITNHREKTQLGLSNLVGRDYIRYREGDIIAAKGDAWNLTFVIDSIEATESQTNYYRGNDFYTRHSSTQYLYCSIPPERLEMLARSLTLSFDMGGKQSFMKSRKITLKYLQEYCRKVRAKMGR